MSKYVHKDGQESKMTANSKLNFQLGALRMAQLAKIPFMPFSLLKEKSQLQYGLHYPG